ncbi:MAG: PAP2 family protein [Breznakibacter sp.]
MKLIARFVSLIFHPLLMPTAGLILIFNLGGPISYLPLEIKRVVLVIVAATTCIIPITLLPLFQMMGLIESVYMVERKERLWPILATAFSFFVGYWILNRVPVIPKFINSFIFFTIVSVILALSITLFWKVSIHMVGMGGISAVITALAWRFNPQLILLVATAFVVAGVVGWARLKTESHKPAEVYVGYLVGFFTVSLSVLF